jgi:DNA-binding transcriptional LysR family regulator
MCLYPRLKASGRPSRQSLDRVFDHCHPAITNCLERLSHCRSDWGRCAYPDETLNGGLGGHIHALDGLVAGLGQNIDLFRYGEQFAASNFEDFGRDSRIAQRVNNHGRYHQLALAGAGVALLAQAVTRADVEHGRLVRVLPEWEPEPVELTPYIRRD